MLRTPGSRLATRFDRAYRRFIQVLLFVVFASRFFCADNLTFACSLVQSWNARRAFDFRVAVWPGCCLDL